jgi:uncharacterized protein
MKKRIVGIDVARALAVIGMIIVNFKIVFGENGDSWLKAFANLFSGKAAATFVVLAGIGLALMTNSAVKRQDFEKLKMGRKRILKRAVFLFIVGLSYLWIWPADILHFYGIYMLICLFFINRNPNQIMWATVSLITLFPITLLFIDYETGWDFTTLEYSGFWTIKGFLRNLFVNGFHPVIPWAAFMLFGLWYGKQDLNDASFVKKSFSVSLIVFIGLQLLSIGSIQLLSNGNAQAIEDLTLLFGTSPMPPLPIYMLNGISISILIISACILIAQQFENNIIIEALRKTGKLALTFYVAHVVLGMGLVEGILPGKLGEYSIEFSLSYALLFSLVCILFAQLWLRYRKEGPLEWVMRKLS